MGTRHLTSVIDENGDEILTMYGQWDGYPTGHGQAIKDAFGHHTLTNGLSSRDCEHLANRMGCLAAQIVAHFKGSNTAENSFHINKPGTRDVGEEFHYILKPENIDYMTRFDAKGRIMLEVYGGPMTFFGSPSEAGATKPIWSGPLADFDPEQAQANYEAAYEIMTDDEKGPKRETA